MVLVSRNDVVVPASFHHFLLGVSERSLPEGRRPILDGGMGDNYPHHL